MLEKNYIDALHCFLTVSEFEAIMDLAQQAKEHINFTSFNIRAAVCVVLYFKYYGNRLRSQELTTCIMASVLDVSVCMIKALVLGYKIEASGGEPLKLQLRKKRPFAILSSDGEDVYESSCVNDIILQRCHCKSCTTKRALLNLESDVSPTHHKKSN